MGLYLAYTADWGLIKFEWLNQEILDFTIKNEDFNWKYPQGVTA